MAASLGTSTRTTTHWVQSFCWVKPAETSQVIKQPISSESIFILYKVEAPPTSTLLTRTVKTRTVLNDTQLLPATFPPPPSHSQVTIFLMINIHQLCGHFFPRGVGGQDDYLRRDSHLSARSNGLVWVMEVV